MKQAPLKLAQNLSKVSFPLRKVKVLVSYYSTYSSTHLVKSSRWKAPSYSILSSSSFSPPGKNKVFGNIKVSSLLHKSLDLSQFTFPTLTFPSRLLARVPNYGIKNGHFSHHFGSGV